MSSESVGPGVNASSTNGYRSKEVASDDIWAVLHMSTMKDGRIDVYLHIEHFSWT